MGQRAANGTYAVQCSASMSTRGPLRSESRMSAMSVGPYASIEASRRSVRGVTYGYE